MEEVRYIEVNGIELAYTKEGQGDPLLFLHGNGEDHRIFDKTVDIMKEYFTCYCIDSRGHGKSTETKEYHYQDMANDILAFIDALKLNNVSICGFSDGGIIGLLAASENDKIQNLIACGANLNPPGVKWNVLFTMRFIYIFKKDPKIKLMIEEPDISADQLKNIHAATLILAGEKDLIRRNHTLKIAGLIPGSTYRIIRGEGHGSYIVHSDKLAKVLLKWFRFS